MPREAPIEASGWLGLAPLATRERYIMGRLFSSFILGLFPGIFGEEFDNGTTW